MEESLIQNETEQKIERFEEHKTTWEGYIGEMKRICVVAGPMVVVLSSQFLLQIVSTMMIGHLGELYLSSAALAISLAGVTGFSFLRIEARRCLRIEDNCLELESCFGLGVFGFLLAVCGAGPFVVMCSV
ncbi:hypothetical protein RIF29_22581 [Crotalaria pallida]|uniref:Uncharacterized protein n=1 Tax=Crotalaria pallida TaxID=3830 RepID=A0AAN9F785_CROPI